MRFKITNILRLGVHGSVQWDITAEGLWYDEGKRMFIEKPDGQNDYSNKCKEYKGKMDTRKIARLLNYWKLPKGTPPYFHWLVQRPEQELFHHGRKVQCDHYRRQVPHEAF